MQSNPTFGIICAMQQECDAILANMTNIEKRSIINFDFFSGKLNGSDVVLMKSGMGKVNAALSTTLMITHFKPDVVINSGSAAALAAGIKIGDVVIADKLSYHDVDVTAFDYKYGQVPKMPEYYFSDSKLLSLMGDADFPEFNIHVGLITSSDSFIADSSQVAHIKKHFPDVSAIDMESSAIAQVCFQFSIPFCIIRSITDHADKDAGHTSDEFLDAASMNASIVTRYLIEVVRTSEKEAAVVD